MKSCDERRREAGSWEGEMLGGGVAEVQVDCSSLPLLCLQGRKMGLGWGRRPKLVEEFLEPGTALLCISKSYPDTDEHVH
jgi:hypothetical protein